MKAEDRLIFWVVATAVINIVRVKAYRAVNALGRTIQPLDEIVETVNRKYVEAGCDVEEEYQHEKEKYRGRK